MTHTARSLAAAITVLLSALLMAGSGGDTDPDGTTGTIAVGPNTAFAAAGDLNGDGFADLVMSLGDLDRVQVYYGGPDGMPSTPSWTATGEAAGDQFGFWVAAAGDVDADGYGDLVVSATNAQGGLGKIYVYKGGAAGLPATATWTAVGEGGAFGYSVGRGGDVNRDGRDEILVGAYAMTESGCVYAYAAVPGTSQLSRVWKETGDDASGPTVKVQGLGWAVSTAGDVNADGYDDVIVCAPTTGISGGNYYNGTYLFLGSPSGLAKEAAWKKEFYSWNNPMFGSSLAPAGDINGDGYDDVLIGSMQEFSYNPAAPGETGAIYLYYGTPGGLQQAEAWKAVGPRFYEWFGATTGMVGDFNGDGRNDIVVGSNYASAYLYCGTEAGFPTTPTMTFDAIVPGGGIWWTVVQPAGDVNGDGVSDLLIGQAGWIGDESPYSRMDVFHGKGMLTGLAQCKLDGATPIAAGGYTLEAGVVIRGRVEAETGGHLEVEVREIGEAFHDAPTHSGGSLPAAGETSVTVPLDLDHSWHWQARAVDAEGKPSKWLCFGHRPDKIDETDFRTRSNTAPTAAFAGVYYGGRPLVSGDQITDTDLVEFRFVTADAHGDDARVDLEIRPAGTTFSGEATATSGLRAPGPVSMTVVLGAGDLSFRWRATDALGAAGAWMETNAKNGDDPGITIPTLHVVAHGSGGTKCGFSGDGRAAFGIALLLAALALAARRS